jgi:predicted short-subunit dehydrogenase-like oxidoreductase (DUF2520 family)
MKKEAAQKIVIIGCGNVAWHLAKQLNMSGNFSLLVVNHKPNQLLRDFKYQLNCKTGVGLNKISNDADYYFICVSDRHISAVSKMIHPQKPGAIVVHTSGSAKIKEIKTRTDNKAVFYPLQTFSKNDAVNWQDIPLILETDNNFTKTQLGRLAKQFSEKVIFMDAEHRLRFHLGAVLVNNFTNALYAAAFDLTGSGKNNKHAHLLLPLIRQTVNKLGNLHPLLAQTGPAKRGDSAVMKKHLGLIADKPQLKMIYKHLSELIIKQQSDAKF